MEIPVKCLGGAGLGDIGAKLNKSLENRLAARVCALGDRTSVRALAPGAEEVPPGGLDLFRLAALGLCQAEIPLTMLRGGLYLVTLAWGYERRRFVYFVLTLERCCVRGGLWLMDHMCWTTGGQVRRLGLRARRFIEQDYEREGDDEDAQTTE
ncbi:hypothetical protein DEO72_LG5g2248 [Vigna unguiculata]|uniref:Uncharacterized protein n=1 Tax=Vigna unguiculata TaxID=3917 RepID=A0A4D6M0Q2_VIGUN|nr:hypothetical protein DEO72_LG5g2248 [Vigna unguiculata]